MGWNPLTIQNITSRLTASENAMLVAASGASSQLQTRLNDAIAIFDSAMAGAGYNVAPSPKMVDLLRNECMAYAIGEFLKDAPLNSAISKTFWTDQRKQAYTDAKAALKAVANREYGAIEDPSGPSRTGNYDSAPAVLGRMFPTTQPYLQFSQVGLPTPPTANQNAATLTPTNAIPFPPQNLLALSNTGQGIQLSWNPPNNAEYFTIYRSTTSGGEIAAGVFVITASLSFFDNLVTQGTTYYYIVTATNTAGVSAASNEASCVAGQPIPSPQSN
jgi:phage gp36-like protein